MNIDSLGGESAIPLEQEVRPASPPTIVRSESAFAASWRRRAQQLQKEAHLLYFVFKHPRTGWRARFVAACSGAYVCSPIQIIPNFIPVIGSMDDFLVVFLGLKLLRRITSAEVLRECRGLAEAEVRGKEKMKSTAAVFTFVVGVMVWLLAGVTASTLMARYIYHR